MPMDFILQTREKKKPTHWMPFKNPFVNKKVLRTNAKCPWPTCQGHEEQGQRNRKVLLPTSHLFCCQTCQTRHPHFSEIHYQGLQCFGLNVPHFQVQEEPLASSSGSRFSLQHPPLNSHQVSVHTADPSRCEGQRRLQPPVCRFRVQMTQRNYHPSNQDDTDL